MKTSSDIASYIMVDNGGIILEFEFCINKNNEYDIYAILIRSRPYDNVKSIQCGKIYCNEIDIRRYNIYLYLSNKYGNFVVGQLTLK